MSVEEIAALEERLQQAELGPDPAFFEEILADDVLIDGEPAKAKIVAAHQPGAAAKFTRIEMTDFNIIDHGSAAVVTCTGAYEGPQGVFTLRFMRVWHKQDRGWRIIAGTILK